MDARHDHMGRIPAGCDILGPLYPRQTLPSEIAVRTHLSDLRAETSGTGDIRIRPIQAPATSAAISTIACILVCHNVSVYIRQSIVARATG
jgi:hypothetical protein